MRLGWEEAKKRLKRVLTIDGKRKPRRSGNVWMLKEKELKTEVFVSPNPSTTARQIFIVTSPGGDMQLSYGSEQFR